MEEEVRSILRDAVNDAETRPWNPAAFTRECFTPLGGVELELPARAPRIPDAKGGDFQPSRDRRFRRGGADSQGISTVAPTVVPLSIAL